MKFYGNLSAASVYASAAEKNGTLHISGQLGWDENKVMPQDFRGQAKQALANIESLLNEAGYKKTDIIKCECFIGNMEDYDVFNEEFGNYFGSHTPARYTIQPGKLPGPVGTLVEIGAIAVK